jgi:aryl-alcohol dehydrogenase-like predicted oxidoreductase
MVVGATRTSQIEENLKALDVLPKLTPEIMKEIDEILGNKPEPVRNFRNY